jgi:hypothetical protein
MTPSRLVKIPRTCSRWNYGCRTLKSVKKNSMAIKSAFVRIADPESKFDNATRTEARKCEELLKETDFWDTIDKSLQVLDILSTRSHCIENGTTGDEEKYMAYLTLETRASTLENIHWKCRSDLVCACKSIGTSIC